MRFAAVIAILLASATARADNRDPDRALAYSLAGTTLAVGLAIPAANTPIADWKRGLTLLVGVELAPSLGHVYAGDYVSKGLVTRVIGGALIVVALKDPFERPGFEIGLSGDAKMVAWLGLGLTIGGTVYDLATSRAAARRHNQRHFNIVPVATHEVTGFALGGAF